MRIRLIVSFRPVGVPVGRLPGLCDRARRLLHDRPVSRIRVLPNGDRMQVEFTLDADRFNDANLRGGRILLRVLRDAGMPGADPEDIDRIGSLVELDDMCARRLTDMSRQLLLD
ncbi:hypothetical protein [Bifidobacterium sp. SO1]|uniref:hypothetical protein n=1 Tax=Bifidobacterium sp. SO1 TaxID=2809029 RepID=UPI001BDDC408|nr:hypothetical protein [Bifidobacterium sp. SO1]MBT1161800.1 hypothetical protein [Bifidobacterium sp. SO1]